MRSSGSDHDPDLCTVQRLPPFPQVALKVLQLLSAESATATDVASTLQLDGAFSTEVLRVANSSLLGLAREVKTVQHATTLLGQERLRAVTLTVAIRGYMMKRVPRTALRPAWWHSVASALIAERLAPRCGLSEDLGYSAGLLHDVGRLAQIAVHAPRYRQFLEAARNHDIDVLDLERDQFGTNHCELALMLAENWQLPGDLALAATRHHSEPRVRESTVVTLTRFGCQLADVLGFHAVRPRPRREREELLHNLREVATSFWQVDLDQLQSQVTDRVKAVEQTLALV